MTLLEIKRHDGTVGDMEREIRELRYRASDAMSQLYHISKELPSHVCGVVTHWSDDLCEHGGGMDCMTEYVQWSLADEKRRADDYLSALHSIDKGHWSTHAREMIYKYSKERVA